MKVNFFRYDGAHGEHVLLALKKIRGLDDKLRTCDLDDAPYRMHSLNLENGIWYGDIVKIRMDDIPGIMSREGKDRDIILEDNEGAGEYTAFQFDTKTKVLAIQANRSGVSVTRFTLYVAALGMLQELPECDFVSDKKPAEIIDQLRKVSKFSIQYAGTNNPKLLSDDGDGTVRNIRELTKTAQTMELTLSAGRGRGGLRLELARAILQKASRAMLKAMKGDDEHISSNSETPLRIDIVGILDGEEKSRDINLTSFLMRETVQVTADAKKRRILYNIRKSAVSEAFERRRHDLEERFINLDD